MPSTKLRARARATRGKRRRKTVNPRFTAATADKYDLYQLSVQSPEEDVRFLARIFRKERGKEATHLREDFSGTGFLCSHWVGRGPAYTAEGFDLDPEPVAWGMEHNFAPLGSAATRMRFHLRDVRAPGHRRAHIRCAHNFSYCVFKTRPELLEYARAVYQDLAPNGLFSIDVHGGPESLEELEEAQVIRRGLDYVWDQAEYWPATAEATCYIHFRFGDGTEMRRAFRYDWRLWTLPEVRDALLEAGFRRVDTYWEGTDKDGESGNGIFRRTRRGENCLSWIAYLIAVK